MAKQAKAMTVTSPAKTFTGRRYGPWGMSMVTAASNHAAMAVTTARAR